MGLKPRGSEKSERAGQIFHFGAAVSAKESSGNDTAVTTVAISPKSCSREQEVNMVFIRSTVSCEASQGPSGG
jgi:hypothetical protein